MLVRWRGTIVIFQSVGGGILTTPNDYVAKRRRVVFCARPGVLKNEREVYLAARSTWHFTMCQEK